MNNPLSEFMGNIDEMTITRKTTLLFLIMVVGMLFIGSFAHMSINRIKNNFDIELKSKDDSNFERYIELIKK